MATRKQLPTLITSTYSGALNLKSRMQLEHPHGIAMSVYRISISAMGSTFVTMASPDDAQAVERQLVNQIRAIVGRSRVVAGFLGWPVSVVESKVAAALRDGISADQVLDELALSCS